MPACELSLAGVRPVVLERLPAPSEEPKANGWSPQHHAQALRHRIPRHHLWIASRRR
ncbi:hypothetical protein [Streptosporangium sp. CA-115845]|uniref:hypothetical protein n=1 Tax=Streptosporangium sp. CA-115845 TaxID=3240071 RepID=UPI003D8A4CF2